MKRNIREHTVIIHNLEATPEVVRELLREDLGTKAEMVDFEVEDIRHYRGAVACMGTYVEMPQRDTIVSVKYKE